MTARSKKLLGDVAAQFENASSPMNHEWLVENHVTLDECGALCDRLGSIIRGYLQSPEHVQVTILACSALPDGGMAETAAAAIARQAFMRLALQPTTSLTHGRHRNNP